MQAANFTVKTDGDKKLVALSEYCSARERRKQVDEPLNSIVITFLHQATVC